MNNKVALGVILGIVVVIAGVIFMMSRPIDTAENNNFNSGSEQSENIEVGGRAVFSVTDAAADMGAVSEINMQITSVEVYNATSGWTTVSTTPRVFNLLDLKARNESELLADADLQSGTYDQIRLMVNSVAVKTKAGAIKIAKLPSNQLLINSNLVVTADKTSSINFDFLADKSLHTTSKGEYVFAPVVKTETRSSSEVTITASGVVNINGGNVDDMKTVGMDIDGSMKTNFQLKSGQKLNINSSNVIELGL
ncbi:MAG: DUF4382 domain-containing protein [Minisyncoccia bacterium]